MKPKNCPWCNCEPATVGRGLSKPPRKGHIDWQCGSFKHGRKPWRSEHCELNVAEAEAERLQTIVDKLPKTADGVPITPGMEIRVRKPRISNQWYQFVVVAIHPNDVIHGEGKHHGMSVGPFSASSLYSTREAAEGAAEAAIEAAREKGVEGERAK